MSLIFSLLATVVTIYTLLCFIDIILSWFPGAKFTKFGKIISSITEPYLRVFSKWKWTHVGYIDFSPIISLGILSLCSSIFGAIGSSGKIIFGRALAEIISQIWGLCSSLLGFLFLLMLVRFIVMLIKKNQYDYNSMWGQLDNFLRPLTERISKPFYKNQGNYKNCLLAATVVLIAVIFLGNIFSKILCNLCLSIPF